MTTKFSLFTGHSYRLRPGCLYSSLLSAWAGLLGYFRFPGQSNCDLRKIAVNLIPHSHVFMRGMRLMAIPSPLALFLSLPITLLSFSHLSFPSPERGKGAKGKQQKTTSGCGEKKAGKGEGDGDKGKHGNGKGKGGRGCG